MAIDQDVLMVIVPLVLGLQLAQLLWRCIGSGGAGRLRICDGGVYTLSQIACNVQQ